MTEQQVEEYEQEAMDLRRHFRVMTVWQAYKACARMWAGAWALGIGEWLLGPHTSLSTRRAFESAMFQLANDFDIANEGWLEATVIREKAVQDFLGIDG